MKILIVEDEVKISNALYKTLVKDGYVVQQVYDGAEALDYITEETYDVVLLDLMIPKISGEQVCKEIRNKNIGTPIIMLTAKSQEENIVNGLEVGADDYITKPFSIVELKARIKAVTRRPKVTLENVIKLKNKVEINISENKVFAKGSEVGLSKKEFLILEHLALNKNKIVTKEKLIENIWGYDSDATDSYVEVYINYIRKKLGKDIIKTKRGFGYYVN